MPRLIRCACFALIAVATLGGCVEAQEAQPPLPQAALQIQTPKGPVSLTVERATTDTQQEAGLMFRTRLGAREGMIFVFAKPAMQAFWMRHTILPLDLIFIRADGTISSIHDHAIPYDERTIKSTEPVPYVLEINAGRAAELGIAPGEHVSGPGLQRGH